MSTKIDSDSVHVRTLFTKLSVSSINSASNQTYTATQVVGGAINRDPNGADRTDTTPTAASLVAEIKSRNAAVESGSAFKFFLYNSSSSNTVTLQGGTGVTVHGSATVKEERVVEIEVVATNATSSSEAVDMYILSNDDT